MAYQGGEGGAKGTSGALLCCAVMHRAIDPAPPREVWQGNWGLDNCTLGEGHKASIGLCRLQGTTELMTPK